MEKAKICLAVIDDAGAAAPLTALAGRLAGRVFVAAIDAPEAAVNAEKAWLISTGGAGAAAAVGAVTRLLEELAPELVITGAGRDGRMLAAHCAAALRTSALTDADELTPEPGAIAARRLVYGGGAYKSVRAAYPAVICAGPSLAGAAAEAAPCAVLEEIRASLPEGMELTGRAEKSVVKVGLGAAKIVLGLGRGVKDAANVERAAAFAARIGAELGCTRPVAEDEGLLPRERYIGVSGAVIKPALYIAAGISGQIQHMAGVNSSGVIIAINKDKQAAIFENCDYGVVGDMMEVLDALDEKLS